jgi:hypothetical protein
MMNTEKHKAIYYSFEDLIEKKGYIVYTNIGYSMLPLLRQKRDIIEVKKKNPGRCKKYDVVLYRRNGQYILHRILKILPDGYLIAGDHNFFVDQKVTDDMILGTMTRVIRDGKTITPDNMWYKLYVHLWCDVYPVRMLLLKVKARIRPVLSRIKHRIIKDILHPTNKRRLDDIAEQSLKGKRNETG